VTDMSRMKVMLSMSEEFLTEIDNVAEEEKRSRSELIREAVRFYLRIRKAKMTPEQDTLIREAIAIQDMLSSQDTLENWDSTAEIRKWRGEI
jgi:metal-responsive CopG/Arc/MetJ family transcriptional regulator